VPQLHIAEKAFNYGRVTFGILCTFFNQIVRRKVHSNERRHEGIAKVKQGGNIADLDQVVVLPDIAPVMRTIFVFIFLPWLGMMDGA
jgi:hypothetical protein